VDYGQTFYDLGFLIWYSYLSLPAGGVLFAIWAVAALIDLALAQAEAGQRLMSKQNMGFLLGAFAIVLLASLPVISVFTAGWIAGGIGCVLNEGDVHPCPLHGFDLGEMLYGMTVMGWFALGTLPPGAIALALLLLDWIIVTIQDRNRAKVAKLGAQ
jgi:hypothetical protein